MLRTGGGNADDLKRPVRAQRGLVAGFRPEHGGLERGRVGRAAAEASIGAGPVRDVPESRNPNTVALFRVSGSAFPGQMMAGVTRPAWASSRRAGSTPPE